MFQTLPSLEEKTWVDKVIWSDLEGHLPRQCNEAIPLGGNAWVDTKASGLRRI